MGERQRECSGWASSGALCVSNSAFPALPRQLSHETKLCEQMVPMVQGLGRNPPRQAGQRVPDNESMTSSVCREPQGRGPRGQRGEAGGRATLGGGAEGRGAEGRRARPGWPLKGRPSWGGHFNRPQLNHCRKLLTAPYGLSRTALLSDGQAVMQKESRLGASDHSSQAPRPASPQTQASLQRVCFFANQRLGNLL